jgi:hypothetical protein
MPILRSLFFAACLLVVVESRAQEATPPVSKVIPDVVFKGIVGKALDALPIEPEQRVVLQRTNAVVSGPLTGRTLSVWAGITNPILLVVGAVWGVYSAMKIKAPETRVAITDSKVPAQANSGECAGDLAFRGAQPQVALLPTVLPTVLPSEAAVEVAQ